jgi:hypothetical protein
MQMPNLLAVATIPVGFIASAAWSAFIVFELFKLTLLLLSNIWRVRHLGPRIHRPPFWRCSVRNLSRR